MSKAKKTTGPLSKADKFSILEYTAQGMTAAEIADKIGKSEKSVNKAIADNKALLSKFAEQTPIINKESFINSEMYDRVLAKLKSAGVDKNTVNIRWNEICSKIDPAELAKCTEEDVYYLILQYSSGRELFIKETTGNGRDGVSVLTKAASEAADSTKRSGTRNRPYRDCIIEIQ